MNYHRVFKTENGLYGVETITISKGKVTKTDQTLSPNYPTVTMAKFGKQAFAEAHAIYDDEVTQRVLNAGN